MGSSLGVSARSAFKDPRPFGRGSSQASQPGSRTESAFRLAPWPRSHPLPLPFPSPRFSRAQGLDPPRPRRHLQATDARRVPGGATPFGVVCHRPFRAFVRADAGFRLVVGPALLDVSSHCAVVPLPVVPHAGAASPRVSSVREAPVESSSVLQDERDERALVVVFSASVVFPSPAWNLAVHPSLAFSPGAEQARSQIGPSTSSCRCRGVARRNERQPP
jgi:hypothetical protein